MRKSVWLGIFLTLVSAGLSAVEVGMVTALAGTAQWQEDKDVSGRRAELKAFVKLRDGDRLFLGPSTRVQIVYFTGGRQESWQGNGTLQIGNESSNAVKGELTPEVRTLPAILVSQLAKMPTPDGIVRAGMTRVRSIPPTVEAAEKNYATLRQQAAAADRQPELYLLAAYFDLRELGKLEALLEKMRLQSPDDPDVLALGTLYRRAISNAKQPGE